MSVPAKTSSHSGSDVSELPSLCLAVWVFTPARGLSLRVLLSRCGARGSHFSGFSCGAQALELAGFSSCGGLSCSTACGVFPDLELNLHPLHR